MRLKTRHIDIDAGNVAVAVLNVDDAKQLRVLPGSRVEIMCDGKKITAVVDVSTKFIERGEIGFFRDLSEHLGFPQYVKVEPTVSPESVYYIKKKIDSGKLSRREIFCIVRDIVENKITDAEAAAFITACYIHGLSLSETANLTEAIVETGEKVEISKSPVVDKHCIGGVPNNRTTMIFVPIMAALGFYIPKTSSRAITSPSGTADTMEVVARVDLSPEEIKEITESIGGTIAWGGGTGIAAADDRLVSIRRPLSLDPEGILLASIVAKKKAVSSKRVIIDIPIGPEAKIKDIRSAGMLGRKFLALGKKLGMKMYTVVSDGCFPVGNGVGPALEARDILEILSGRGPKDLRQKALELTAYMISFCKGVPQTTAYRKAEVCLRDGSALKKMREIIEAQDGDPDIEKTDIEIGKYRETVVADRDGCVVYVSNSIVSSTARLAGAPQNKRSGVYLHKKVGHNVRKGDVLMTVFSDSRKRLRAAMKPAEYAFVIS